VAALVELAQSEAVTNRKEYRVAYDLDSNTYWLVLPPADPDQGDGTNGQPSDPAAALGGDAPAETTKEGRPVDDLEHGPPPPDPNAPADGSRTETDAEREALSPKSLPDDVVFQAVVVGDDEKTSGQVMVPFTRLGSDGTHVIGLKLAHGTEQDQIWVKFNSLTRTIEYYDQRPEVKTLSAGDAQ
jgi:hypothetical protein